ncbi:ABC transporter ATP-binding protein [Catenuloplanes japonicus]|uniref:ABC transporter ATP-binding protein n=1 Tax=Catenuloplanes japonicus TaxID=33876 RepID=UPI00068FA439|nr:ABC transporter ATP-binding protein [Catenuloplanes japonicus]
MSVLSVRDLAVDLMTGAGVIRAVDGISFDIDAGETVTIIGESGSGKSTTAMALLRLLPDDLAVITGHAEIAGRDVAGTRKHIGALRGRTVALIPQDPMTALNPIATIGRQMVEAIRISNRGLSRTDATRKAVGLLRDVHIKEPERRLKAYPHQLSGGQLQRVLIAMALSTGAELIVADEPTSALDVTVQAGILDLLLEIQETTGAALLLITHDLGVARLMSDRIHVMKAGQFVESGDVEDVIGNPAHEYTRTLLDALPSVGPWEEVPV